MQKYGCYFRSFYCHHFIIKAQNCYSNIELLQGKGSYFKCDRFIGKSLKNLNKVHKEEKKMDVDLLFKIAAIGIIVAVLHQVLVRAGREDQAMMTTLTGLIIVLAIVVTQISDLFNTVKTLFDL